MIVALREADYSKNVAVDVIVTTNNCQTTVWADDCHLSHIIMSCPCHAHEHTTDEVAPCIRLASCINRGGGVHG